MGAIDLPDPNNQVQAVNGTVYLNYTPNDTEAGDRLIHRWISVLKACDRKALHVIPFSIYPRNQ